MPNRDRPKGFEPVTKLDGSKIPTWTFPVDSSNGTAIFVGDLVSAESDGNIAPSAADAGVGVLGAAVAIYDTNMVPAGHPNAAFSNKHLPASTAGFVTVALAMPDAVFRVQTDSGTNVAETARFATANHVAGAGDTTTSQSRHELDADNIDTGSQCMILDKVDEPGNAWDDAHVDVYVLFAESVFSPITNQAAGGI